MKYLVTCIAVLALLAGCSSEVQTLTRPEIGYVFTYGADGTSVEVSINFTGDMDGETQLVLPSEWGGETELYTSIRLNVVQGAELSPTDVPHEFTLAHDPGALIQVSYDIIQDWDGVPTANGRNPYRPVIQPDYVHMIGWTVLVLPVWDAFEADPLVRLDYDQWPESWTIADNVDVGRGPRSFEGDLNRIQAGLFVAGDFELTEVDVDGAPFRFAIRGDWPFDEAELVANITAVVTAQRAFWAETSTAPFLVTLIPLDNGGHEDNLSWGGTGLVDSFALFATTNTALDSFQGLASHEFMHRWIAAGFGRAAEPEAGINWFNEGFTDYFATQVQLQAGLIDLQGYADQTNTAIREYYRSPARGMTNDDIAEQFWEDSHVNRYPYLHGRMLGARWHQEIRDVSQNTMSLGGFLRDWLMERRAIEEDGGTLDELSTEMIVREFTNHYFSRIGNDAHRFITNGDVVPVEDGMFGQCLMVQDSEFALYDLGLDIDASFAAQAATGVDEGGPAFAAGVREGQRLYGYSISQRGDPNSPVTLYLEIGGEPRMPVQYLPQSNEIEIIPQLVLQDPLLPSDADACVAWLVD